ncbi:MAG: YbaK/EbsC family protein, partial [Oscillospiraceae bacterium]
TMSFKTGDTCALVVMSGDKKVDNQKFKATFGIKAVMLHPDEVVALVGHAIGGVCPFAVKDTSKVYLDVSLKRFETVYPAAGSSDSVIKLSITELEHLSNSQGWVDVGKQISPIIAEVAE